MRLSAALLLNAAKRADCSYACHYRLYGATHCCKGELWQVASLTAPDRLFHQIYIVKVKVCETGKRSKTKKRDVLSTVHLHAESGCPARQRRHWPDAVNEALQQQQQMGASVRQSRSAPSEKRCTAGSQTGEPTQSCVLSPMFRGRGKFTWVAIAAAHPILEIHGPF
jgi:hypothetical protein